MTIFRFCRGWVVAALLSVGLIACTPTFSNHGYIPPEEDLALVQIGASREAVAEAIGHPRAAGVISDDTWFYVASRQRFYTYHAAEVIERDIVAISFDSRGRVQNIRELGLEDGEIVRLSRRVTESNIQEVTFLRQLIGNIGRVSIGEALAGN